MRVVLRGRLCVFTFTLPKLRVVGETVTTVPTPLRPTTCGLLGASSVMLIAPLRVLIAPGVNVTLTVQKAPGARVLGLMGQLLL